MRAFRPGLAATLIAAAVLVLGYGCSSFEPDTVFACGEAQLCPEPLVCIDGWCEAATSTGGGAGETGGGAGETGGGAGETGGGAGETGGGASETGGGAGETGGGAGETGGGAGETGGGAGETGGGAGETGGGAGGGGGGNACVDGDQSDPNAIYVDPNAPESPAEEPDGTANHPYRDLAQAIKGPGGQVIYIARGTLEMAELHPTGHAARIEGGWAPGAAGSWVKDCSPAAQPTLLFSGTVGVTHDANGAPLELRDLVIAQTGVADAGPSVGGSFAVWVKSGAQLTLTRTSVASRRAADGITPPGPPDATSPTCTSPPTCGSGHPGNPGGHGFASDGGTFGTGGFIPGDGTNGNHGGPGEPGTSPPSTGFEWCATSCESGCGNGGNCPNASSVSATPRQVPPGTCGCGGNPGEGGPGGRGGEASVAVLVTGPGAVFAASSSTLTCGGGGNGAVGAFGGDASNGTRGQPGQSYWCAAPGTACFRTQQADPMCGSCVPNEFERDGGLAGGAGGFGGNGGRGGSGAGGPCYGIVVVNDAPANVTTDGTVQFVIKAGGYGQQGAADGASDTRLDTTYP